MKAIIDGSMTPQLMPLRDGQGRTVFVLRADVQHGLNQGRALVEIAGGAVVLPDAVCPAEAIPAADGLAAPLPCPFCGGPARVVREDPNPPEIPHHWWIVECPKENACLVWPTAVGDSRAEAVTAWNTRRADGKPAVQKGK